MKSGNKTGSGIFLGIFLAVILLGSFWSLSRTSHEPKQKPLEEISSNSVLGSPSQKGRPGGRLPSAESGGTRSSEPSKTRAQETDHSSLEKFLRSFDPQADWRINTGDGRVLAISGGLIQGHASSSESLYQFAQTVAELTGIPAQQLGASQTRLEDTPQTWARQFDQEIEGFRVFGAYMKIFVRQSDGAIYYIANETRDVGKVDLQILVTGTEASQIALQAYAGKKGVVVDRVSSRPYIYPNSTGQPAELVWEVILSIEGPLVDRRDLLISARNGHIVKDVTLLKY